jgi:hypothetical protein
VESYPEIALKGSTVPYTAFNGRMFSYFEKDGSFGMRLPEKELGLFLKKYKTTPFISYVIIKKEFVLVPNKLFGNFKEFRSWFDISLSYVKTLKAK